MSEQVIGHNLAKKYLQQIVEQKKLAHAYLFTGPRGVGKTTLVKFFIQQLNNLPPDTNYKSLSDVLWLARLEDKKEILIDQIRQAIDFLHLDSWNKNYRIVVIKEAERMNEEASNALLKTLEEPLGKGVILLITEHAKNLLPTIISRCQLINLGPVSTVDLQQWLKNLKIPASQVEELVHLAQGIPGQAYDVWQNKEQWQGRLVKAREFLVILRKQASSGAMVKINLESLSQDEALGLLGVFLEVARDLILYKYGLSERIRYYALYEDFKGLLAFTTESDLVRIIKLLNEAIKKIKANSNIKLTFEWLFINLS